MVRRKIRNDYFKQAIEDVGSLFMISDDAS
jgi:hypothetical protein